MHRYFTLTTKIALVLFVLSIFPASYVHADGQTNKMNAYKDVSQDFKEGLNIDVEDMLKESLADMHSAMRMDMHQQLAGQAILGDALTGYMLAKSAGECEPEKTEMAAITVETVRQSVDAGLLMPPENKRTESTNKKVPVPMLVTRAETSCYEK